MTNQLKTHHLAISALLGLVVALAVPAALVVALACAALLVGGNTYRLHRHPAAVRR